MIRNRAILRGRFGRNAHGPNPLIKLTVKQGTNGFHLPWDWFTHGTSWFWYRSGVRRGWGRTLVVVILVWGGERSISERGEVCVSP